MTTITSDNKSSLKEEAYNLSDLDTLSNQEILNILADQNCPLWFLEHFLGKKEHLEFPSWLKAIVESHNIEDLALNIDLEYMSFDCGNFDTAIFNGSRINFTIFEDCDFDNATFVDTKMINSVISTCSFSPTTFTNCIIQDVDFYDCELSYVTFDSCTFIGNKLDGSIFKKVSFNNCSIKNIKWSELDKASEGIEIL